MFIIWGERFLISFSGDSVYIFRKTSNYNFFFVTLSNCPSCGVSLYWPKVMVSPKHLLTLLVAHPQEPAIGWPHICWMDLSSCRRDLGIIPQNGRNEMGDVEFCCTFLKKKGGESSPLASVNWFATKKTMGHRGWPVAFLLHEVHSSPRTLRSRSQVDTGFWAYTRIRAQVLATSSDHVCCTQLSSPSVWLWCVHLCRQHCLWQIHSLPHSHVIRIFWSLSFYLFKVKHLLVQIPTILQARRWPTLLQDWDKEMMLQSGFYGNRGGAMKTEMLETPILTIVT